MLKKRNLSSIITFLLVLTMTISMFSVSVHAADITPAEKTATKQADETYEVKIQVPGGDGNDQHDEVILMVDGSYSGDDEWEQICNAIIAVGETALNGTGKVQLTLMAFGMGDNMVLEHVKSVDELKKQLGELPGTLLYGRSSTNCEAGLTGVQEYIEEHDATLNDAYVIFISDGEINTDETPRNFYDWRNICTYFDDLFIAKAAFKLAVSDGENLPVAFKTTFGTKYDGMESTGILEAAFGEGGATDEEFFAFCDQIWKDVYEFAGFVPGNTYPVSEMEYAFVKYDETYGTYIQDTFYYSTFRSVTYPNKSTRTPEAATALAAMEKVAHLYMVDTNGATSWMDPAKSTDSSKNVVGENVSFTYNAQTGGLTTGLSEVLKDLAATPYNDVVVTDYMSKWVNLDYGSIRIVDNAAGQVIWTVTDGWKIGENRPTEKENPVEIEPVSEEGYEAGGEDVIGNSSGEIYKLTWYIKDGALLRSDSYSLVYNVLVDVEEDGFRFDQVYPANGNTYMEYKDENGDEQEEDIEVPFVVEGSERILHIYKYGPKAESDAAGTGEEAEISSDKLPLENIEFAIYWVGTKEEVADQGLEDAKAYYESLEESVLLEKQIASVKTDVTGHALYNFSANGRPDGVYMVVEKTGSAVAEVADPFFVSVPLTNAAGDGWLYEIYVYPKNDITDEVIVDKDVTEIGNKQDSADVNEAIQWIIRGNIPVGMYDETENGTAYAKKYVINDTLDYRLTYTEGSLNVTLLNKAAEEVKLNPKDDYVLTVNDVKDKAENSTVQLVVSLTDDGIKKVVANLGNGEAIPEIRVEFETVINTVAKEDVIGEIIYNNATVEYTNYAGWNYSDEVDEKPYVYTCGINIYKYNAKDIDDSLSGAVFKLAKAVETATEETSTLVTKEGPKNVIYVSFYDNADLSGEKVSSVITDNDGKAVIYGLEAGEYYLVETKAPEGYNLLSYPVSVTLNLTSHESVNVVTVANSNTFRLPSTGGVGTTIFTAGGILLIAAACVMLVKKKKEEN